jgi:hypothetical protein
MPIRLSICHELQSLALGGGLAYRKLCVLGVSLCFPKLRLYLSDLLSLTLIAGTSVPDLHEVNLACNTRLYTDFHCTEFESFGSNRKHDCRSVSATRSW